MGLACQKTTTTTTIKYTKIYNSLKQLTVTVDGLLFGRAYYRKDICVRYIFWGGGCGGGGGLLSEFYGIRSP